MNCATLYAGDYFYLSNVKNCSIKQFRNGKLSITAKKHLANVQLEMTQVPRHPRFLSFNYNNKTYVTSTSCVYLANGDHLPSKQIQNPPFNEDISFYEALEKNMLEKELITHEKDTTEAIISVTDNFLEINGGQVTLPSQDVQSVSYNDLFPGDTNNPTTWNTVSTGKFHPKMFLSIEYGNKLTENGFLDLKIKTIKGSKVDSLSLTNLSDNSSVGDNWLWTYNEALTNFYGGYKYIWQNDSRWRPTLAGFLGLSVAKSILSDDINSYSFSSTGLAALAEVGLEYYISSHIGLNFNLGYEYLAPRTLNSEHSDGTVTSSPTQIDFSNLSLSIGLKSYF